MTFPRATSEQRRERTELDARFGKIGISAVAAAVRYQGEPQSQKQAKPATAIDDRSEDNAA
jgi:hypothetical protein